MDLGLGSVNSFQGRRAIRVVSSRVGPGPGVTEGREILVGGIFLSRRWSGAGFGLVGLHIKGKLADKLVAVSKN